MNKAAIMGIKVFMIHVTGLTHRYLRRYASGSTCELGHGYHNADVFIDKGIIGEASTSIPGRLNKLDPRWPTHCKCGYKFKPEDEWQLDVNPEYCRADDHSKVYRRMDAPVGAMWDADWYGPESAGPDGLNLMVRTPGGDWLIDGKASNCGRPEDDVHKCWIRHGVPPNITVNKNGDTCSAGAGSI